MSTSTISVLSGIFSPSSSQHHHPHANIIHHPSLSSACNLTMSYRRMTDEGLPRTGERRRCCILNYNTIDRISLTYPRKRNKS
ncbi:hypothetical protein SCHPADRAFT_640734 [Schizopora paradoxa]|uniref:Uncharacterized protein n=1 Tax=Schizopora paradoxa TaxID=27342 RepID=A0A0H2R715_9AGAM|nr:hypothetical protein SCHPADRAFT_640734 [Schizopora paradoxa]